MDGEWDEASYRAFFAALNGFAPYDFQVRVAQRLADRRPRIVFARRRDSYLVPAGLSSIKALTGRDQ